MKVDISKAIHYWINLKTKDKVIDILSFIFIIIMFFVARMYFYILLIYISLMFIVKFSTYVNELDKLKHQIKKKNEYPKRSNK